MHLNREELQAHASQTSAGGPFRPHRQHHPDRIHRSCRAASPVQRLDAQHRAVQRPADHPQPARDGSHQPVLPGLLADGGRPCSSHTKEEGPQGRTERPPEAKKQETPPGAEQHS